MTDLVAPGETVRLSGNESATLDDPSRSWIVDSGRVLVFAVDAVPGPDGRGSDAATVDPPGPRNLVLEAGEGDLVCGVDSAGAPRRWLVIGIAQATIRPVTITDLVANAGRPDAEQRRQLERWLVGTSMDDGEGVVATLLAEPDPVAALRAHNRQAVFAEAAAASRQVELESSRIEAAEAHVASVTDTAVDALASVFDWRRFLASQLVDREDELVDACRIVGDRLAVTIVPPRPEDLVRSDALTAIARASKVRFRKVGLDEGWWRQEGEPLVGELANGRHVALLPRRRRGYDLHDPVTGDSIPVTAAVAEDIKPVAIAMVRPLPGRGVDLPKLILFSLRGESRDMTKTVVFAAVIAVLALVPPLATQVVFGQIVPRADYGRLMALVAGLVGVAIATALLEAARGIALLRSTVRSDGTQQMALFDRMLRLPPTFFRRYQVGDLADRSMVVDKVADQVDQWVVLTLIGSAFGLSNLVAMLLISPQLAVVGFLLCLVGGLVMYLTRRAYHQPQAEMLAGSRALSSEVLQYMTGIVKIRTSGSERRVFARWANSYAQQNVRALRTFKIDNVRVVFQTSFRTAAMFVLFVAVYFIGREDLPPATFMAFYLAFGQLLYSIFRLAQAFVTTLEGIPILEQARPIIDSPTEADEPKEHPGQLLGRLEVRNVRFRYPDAPHDLFADVSVTIEPGEFVAVVGPSGSGKSTFLRLLLGFDKPDAGAVFYDGKDLSSLDIDAVRQQLGVVLQQTALLPGTIYQNIAGSAELTDEEVWEAARRAGFDRDIEQLPRGMQTEVGDGVGVLSGGQCQRLQIARAVASKPRLMYLDEATSALDNLTQSVVSRTVSEMPITRVVIAHRLSTISAADRVVVIAGGRVVQDGPFDELAATPGPFKDLIARQQL